MVSESRLKTLAGTDKVRIQLLADRATRSKSRSRWLTCPTCGEKGYSDRGNRDICDACLIDLWGSKNVLAGAYRAGKKSGLVASSLTKTFHWLDYPSLATRSHSEAVPTDAVFYREDRDSSDSIMQKLYVELFTALSEVLPCDPSSRQAAERVIPGGSSYNDEDILTAMLPKTAVKALQDLWAFIRWVSHESRRQGFAEGHNLLSRMNLGDLTHQGFIDEIADQTKNSQEALKKAARRQRTRQ